VSFLLPDVVSRPSTLRCAGSCCAATSWLKPDGNEADGLEALADDPDPDGSHDPARGSASPAISWQRYAELAQWSSWAPHIIGVEAEGTYLRIGLTGVVRVVSGLGVPFTVTAVDHAAMTWSWIARVAGIALTMTHTVVPTEGGSASTLAMEGPSALLTAYTPVAQIALFRLVR